MKLVIAIWGFVVFAALGEAALIVRHAPDNDKTISLLSKHSATRNQLESSGLCEDSNGRCPAWADSGECTRNPNYMLANCQLSCGVCSSGAFPIEGQIKPTSRGTVVGVHVKDASWIDAWWSMLGLGVKSFLPYAIMVCILAFVWYELGGRLPPQLERKHNPQDFAYGLCSLDHCLDSHMWICVCAFCCVAIRTADTISKSSEEYNVPRAIIPSFWLALAFVLGIEFLFTITGGLGWILAVAVGVYFRQRIRRMYGLPNCTGKVLAWDCLFWCCCPWCSIAQEARQVQFITGDPVQVMPTEVLKLYEGLPAQAPAQVASGQIYEVLPSPVSSQVISGPVYEVMPTQAPLQMMSGPIYGGMPMQAPAQIMSGQVYGGMPTPVPSQMMSGPMMAGQMVPTSGQLYTSPTSGQIVHTNSALNSYRM